ncbi:hypothetical protein K4A83_05675 [Spirulina subsalsa FACHB-351]|uniref:XRE family transcriptional regulator n=1 Tax=Spirulina subsalsa FACHB-351 TaxID=234711 RepID=A0ABT3L2M3_9CYAN|nr:hypothetical protein [Spirulina subsalsa]MCW6035763.1 hypothetical protein [Spirulina subsalsa FACHB-351]
MANPDASTSFPFGYQQRLQELLESQWQVGESYARFAERLGLGSGKTLKAWLTQDFKAEPDPQKLRKLAQFLGWSYWELICYLDTGKQPEAIAPSPDSLSSSPVHQPSPLKGSPQFSRGLLLAATRQMQDLAVTLQEFIEGLPPEHWYQSVQAVQAVEVEQFSPPPSLPSPPPLPRGETALETGSDLTAGETANTAPPVMTLAKMIQVCLEKAAMSPTQLRDRIEDYRRYSSLRSPLTAEEFNAMCEGDLIPQSEAQLEELADIVDRDRDYFSTNEWLKAWIASIYHGNVS